MRPLKTFTSGLSLFLSFAFVFLLSAFTAPSITTAPATGKSDITLVSPGSVVLNGGVDLLKQPAILNPTFFYAISKPDYLDTLLLHASLANLAYKEAWHNRQGIKAEAEADSMERYSRSLKC